MGHGRTCRNAETNDEQSIFHRRRALACNEKWMFHCEARQKSTAATKPISR